VFHPDQVESMLRVGGNIWKAQLPLLTSLACVASRRTLYSVLHYLYSWDAFKYKMMFVYPSCRVAASRTIDSCE